MFRKVHTIAGALLLLSGRCPRSNPSFRDNAKFRTGGFCHVQRGACMQTEARRSLAIFLAEYSARHRGVVLPNDDRGTQLA